MSTRGPEIRGQYYYSVKLRGKVSQKVLYHSAIFVIVDKILIIKCRRILIFNNFLFKHCQSYRKQQENEKNCSFFSHRILRIFSEFFINFSVLHFLI